MAEHVWCHGPNCHTYHTLDRVRGVKGSKVLRTRKIKTYADTEYRNMYNYFCSNSCYDNFANKYIEQVINIAPRREPLETPILDPVKDEEDYWHRWKIEVDEHRQS